MYYLIERAVLNLRFTDLLVGAPAVQAGEAAVPQRKARAIS